MVPILADIVDVFIRREYHVSQSAIKVFDFLILDQNSESHLFPISNNRGGLPSKPKTENHSKTPRD